MKTIYVCGCGLAFQFLSILRCHQALECDCLPLPDELRSIPD